MMTLDHLLLYGTYALFAASAVLGAESIYLAYVVRRGRTSAVNRRLARHRDEVNPEDVLRALRHERGLDADGNYALPLIAMNRLFLQSGARMSPRIFFGTFGLGAVAAAFLSFLVTRQPLLAQRG